MTTLDPNNPTQAQIDGFNADYVASLSPNRKALYAGTFGIPGTALEYDARYMAAFRLGATEKVDLMTDGFASSPAMVFLNRYRSNYEVFSYVGEPNPDWATAPPGQDLPNTPPYNPAGHTGIAGLAGLTAPAPYAPPGSSGSLRRPTLLDR